MLQLKVHVIRNTAYRLSRQLEPSCMIGSGTTQKKSTGRVQIAARHTSIRWLVMPDIRFETWLIFCLGQLF